MSLALRSSTGCPFPDQGHFCSIMLPASDEAAMGHCSLDDYETIEYEEAVTVPDDWDDDSSDEMDSFGLGPPPHTKGDQRVPL